MKIFSWFHFSIFNFYKNNYKKKSSTLIKLTIIFQLAQG
ncbi:hypothetical protein SF123566_7968 [Shigella flexneri 1235-66]|nr:hypothetical protein SF123566_7968 [Shigella flexneri 1235-66]